MAAPTFVQWLFYEEGCSDSVPYVFSFKRPDCFKRLISDAGNCTPRSVRLVPIAVTSSADVAEYSGPC